MRTLGLCVGLMMLGSGALMCFMACGTGEIAEAVDDLRGGGCGVCTQGGGGGSGNDVECKHLEETCECRGHWWVCANDSACVGGQQSACVTVATYRCTNYWAVADPEDPCEHGLFVCHGECVAQEESWTSGERFACN